MKKLIVGIAAGLLAVSLAACSGTGSPDSTDATAGAPGPAALENAEGVTDITFWHGLQGAAGKEIETLIAQFNAENEGEINVTSSFQGSYADLLAKYTAGLRDNSTPTVIVAGDIASGYLKDVQRSVSPAAMAEANPEDLDLSEIRPAAANYYSVDGELFAIPLNMSTPVLWVNRAVLTAAGLGGSTPLATLDDVAAAARIITETTGLPGIVQPFDGWWFEQLTAASGDLYCTPENGRGADGLATGVSLTGDAQHEAFQTMADLYTSGVGLDVGVDGNAAITAFTAGQVGFMLNGSGIAGTLAGAGGDFEAMPYPISGNLADSGTVIGGSAMWLSNTATDAEQVAGWKLESFLAGAATQEAFSQATGYIPVNITVDDSATQQEFLSTHPASQVFLDQLAGVPTVPATAGCLSGAMTAVRGAVVPEMQAAFSGSKSLDDALEAAESAANAAFDQYIDQLG